MEFTKDIEKGHGLKIRISIQEYKGAEFLDLRQYYLSEDNGEYKPSPKGVTLNPQLLDELIHVLQDLKKEIEK